MNILKVITAFDERLLKKAMPIETFDKNLETFAQDLANTNDIHQTVGLSSIQVEDDPRFEYSNIAQGYRAQGNLIYICYEQTRMFLANAKILEQNKELDLDFEGCASIPGLYEKVQRSTEITVEYNALDGTKKNETFKGFIARIIQHEIDHSNGILFPERMAKFNKLMAWQKYAKQKNHI